MVSQWGYYVQAGEHEQLRQAGRFRTPLNDGWGKLVRNWSSTCMCSEQANVTIYPHHSCLHNCFSDVFRMKRPDKDWIWWREPGCDRVLDPHLENRNGFVSERVADNSRVVIWGQRSWTNISWSGGLPDQETRSLVKIVCFTNMLHFEIWAVHIESSFLNILADWRFFACFALT